MVTEQLMATIAQELRQEGIQQGALAALRQGIAELLALRPGVTEETYAARLTVEGAW